MPVAVGKLTVTSTGAVTSLAKSYSAVNSYKKKSRLSVYLNTITAEGEEESEFNFFKESEVDKVLEEHQERLKKVKIRDKLNLVWKGSYDMPQTYQECLEELVHQREAIKHGKLRCPARFKSFTSTSQAKSIIGDLNHARDSTAKLSVTFKKRTSLGKSDLDSCSLAQKCSTKQRSSITLDPFVSIAGSCNQTNPSYKYKRTSKNTFNTRKATGNQESNMYQYPKDKEKKVFNKVLSFTKTYSNQKYYCPTFDSKVSPDNFRRRLKELVPELKTKVDPETLMRAYLTEQVLELLLQGPDVVELRKMYQHVIVNRPVVHNLIQKHPDMLPAQIFKDLVTFKKGFEVNPIYTPTVVKADDSMWRKNFSVNLISNAQGSILLELEKDIPVYGNFFKSLIEKRIETITVDSVWLREQKPYVLREMLLHQSIKLRIARNSPGSTIRFEMMNIMVAGSHNSKLLRQLSLNVETWLDQLAKGLHSNFKSIREETVQVLCFMLSYFPLMKELYVSKYFDVIQDLTTSILRAMDTFDDTYAEYHILLAYVMHYCPSRSTLDCIIDRCLSFKCTEIILRWPRFIYYAVRYWQDDSLSSGSRFGVRLIRALEGSLLKQITSKVSRLALYYMQARFKNVSRIFTIHHYKKEEKTVLDVLGVKKE